MLKHKHQAEKSTSESIRHSNMNFLKDDIKTIGYQKLYRHSLIHNSNIYVVISNCVLNLVNPSNLKSLIEDIYPILKPNGPLVL